MDPFDMDTAAVAGIGAGLMGLASQTGAAAATGAAAMPRAAEAFGLVGADYLAALASALVQTGTGLQRLTLFYGSAGAGAAGAVTRTAAVEANAVGGIGGAVRGGFGEVAT